MRWSWTNQFDGLPMLLYLLRGHFCQALKWGRLGCSVAVGGLRFYPSLSYISTVPLLLNFTAPLCSSTEEDYHLKHMLGWLCDHQLHSPFFGARSQRMFVRKPNPALTLIQGQRNSCNLSLYLLRSLFPFSLSLSPSHTHWVFPLPTPAFLISALFLLCVTDNGHYGCRKSPQHDLAAVAVEGQVITFHHSWKYPCECVAAAFSFLRASPICR